MLIVCACVCVVLAGNDSSVDGLVNFEKLRMIAKEIRHVVRLTSANMDPALMFRQRLVAFTPRCFKPFFFYMCTDICFNRCCRSQFHRYRSNIITGSDEQLMCVSNDLLSAKFSMFCGLVNIPNLKYVYLWNRLFLFPISQTVTKRWWMQRE